MFFINPILPLHLHKHSLHQIQTFIVPEIKPSIVSLLPYPNPANEYVCTKFLNGTYPSTVMVTTYDVLGRMISTKKIEPASESINVTNYRSGIYISVVTDMKKKKLGSFRFVKN